MTAARVKLEASKSVVPSSQETSKMKTTKPDDARIVSFRNDVVFEHTGWSNMSVSSHSSKASETSGSKYSKLRSSLTHEHRSRDPLFSYQITRHLGSGSMGDVKLVKKRQDKLGGSARRDCRSKKSDSTDCFHIFQYCINAGDETSDRGFGSHHSVLSIFNGKEDSTVSTARSFEDSILNKEPSTAKEIIYAMKSIHLDQMTEQVFIDELRQEIAVLKHLDHPNIVRAIETFEFEGMISLVMELCSGGDLYVRDPYTEADAARIVSSILSAIAYMHSQNVIHRDLKFENVLFVNTSPMSDVKLIDFGLARVYAGGDKLTDVSGTIYTIAPEVLMNNHTEKADMWSIGVIAYMLLSSSVPFYGKTRDDIAQKILGNQWAFKPNSRWKRVSSLARQFIEDLLVMNPDERLDAESALGSTWLNPQLAARMTTASMSHGPPSNEEALVISSILRYATYPKLKKMALMVVAHKSSTEDIGILRKIFESHVSHHDGAIWFDEFCSLMKGSKLSQSELSPIFDAMVWEGDGRIRYTEFIAATIEAHGTVTELNLAEAFDRLDCDDSGFITANDLMELLGSDVPLEEVDDIIAEISPTKDGSISYSDFLALWEGDNLYEKEDHGAVGQELSSISIASSTQDEAHAAFLKGKHHQNTLHAWAIEMKLPAHEFVKGCHFLHLIALRNQPYLENILDKQPALVNFRDYDRRTPLHIAASEGLVDICKFLIKKGARINRNDRWGGSPMDDAHRHGHTDVINLLREYQGKFGNTSQIANLITAASEGNAQEVKTLLELGSLNLNQGDYDHRTALHLAANEGHVDVVKLLVDAGANVKVKDRWGSRPMDDAKNAKKNSKEIMNILIGTTFNSISQFNGEINDLRVACLREVDGKDKETTKFSVDEFGKGCTLLHQVALGNQLVLEKMVLECPALVNFRDYDRRTPLHIAASEGHVNICRYLVEKGGLVNRCDRWGGSPLDDAHREQHLDVAKFLKSKGAKFGSTSHMTNFITAASTGDIDEVKAFLDFGGIDLNKGDYDKRTALHLAAGEGHINIVRILCEAGANTNVEDRWGHRPIDDASSAKRNSNEIMKLLLKYDAESTRIGTNIRASFLRSFMPK